MPPHRRSINSNRFKIVIPLQLALLASTVPFAAEARKKWLERLNPVPAVVKVAKVVVKPVKELVQEVAKPLEELRQEIAKPLEQLRQEVAKPLE